MNVGNSVIGSTTKVMTVCAIVQPDMMCVQYVATKMCVLPKNIHLIQLGNKYLLICSHVQVLPLSTPKLLQTNICDTL